jgi:AraC-like DNA-binding protein
MPADYSVYAAPINRVLQAAEQFGVGQHTLLADSDIDPAALKLPDNRFPLASLIRLYHRAEQLTENPDIGVNVGRITYLTGLSLQIYMGMICRSFRDYLNLMPSILKMSGDVGEVKIRSEDDYIRLEWVPLAVETSHQRYLSDEFMTASACIVDSLCFLPVPVRRARFSYSEPPEVSRLRQMFGDDIAFDAEVSCLYLDRASLNYPLVPQDHSMRPDFGANFSHLFDESSPRDIFATSLHQSIANLLPKGELGIDAVAGRLNISRRTLQRRLSDRDTSFQQVLQQVRQQLSARYLTDSRLAITEIAYLLGYSDQTSFSTAFKSWHGQTPRDYRQSL